MEALALGRWPPTSRALPPDSPAQGYAPNTVQAKCAVLADLSRWLERRRLSLAALDEGRLTQFLANRRRRGEARRGDPATGQQLLGYLRDRDDIAAAAQRIDRTAAACLTRDFEEFLHCERGLSRSTVVSYLPIVRSFLDERFGRKALRLEQLRAQDLHGFILREVQRVSRSHGKGVVTALRSFLRFLLQRGAIRTDLARMLPGVASWRLSHLPKSLPPEQVERLLACCDRSTPSGKRDYAILLLLARLGLRGGEVLAMTLDDLDWECGEIVVRGKGQRLERLPLPADVGAALACYLCDVRPRVRDASRVHPDEGSPAGSRRPGRHLLHRSSRSPSAPGWTRSSKGRTCCATPSPPICFAAARR